MAGQDGDAGEWNQVKRRGGRLRNIPAPTNEAADSLVDGIRPNTKPELSVNDLWNYHESVTQDSQTTEWWDQVRQLLDSILNKPGCPTITRAVCLGPGPYEPSNGSSIARRTAHMQTAAFCCLVGCLSRGPSDIGTESPIADHHTESQDGRDIHCVVQEPRFTETDKEFCAKLGVEAVESPAGFSLVDESTLLFGIHMELDIYNQAMVIPPAIYVGASLEEWEKVVDGGSETEGPLAAYGKMDKTYDRYPFPDLDYMFSSTVMYWRRAKT
ncbi:hypothetical protein CHGG_06088 [Chaetomium globosum CBS 148.51]|uniref:SRR1-like domain-containing protein n=1 Tax=Chaetomium globosum (strain ATCC 6205 / CBS 148.51 / DSM 1962 / NBRC 6347 / NRRL 1970) TaxID=306901 RepID=Q2H5H7_CHAGB|nr:uncharacterized protein CHGG_06088 [Chaetomium globosum CBS 148.51]EAQ89469.1 hypothetical protein CHGG_06088 [Chaetomium globosum CBS 148.51]